MFYKIKGNGLYYNYNLVIVNKTRKYQNRGIFTSCYNMVRISYLCNTYIRENDVVLKEIFVEILELTNTTNM